MTRSAGWLIATVCCAEILSMTAFSGFVTLLPVLAPEFGLNNSQAGLISGTVKAHISVLLAAVAVIKAISYWFDRYELTLSSGGVVQGASYADVHARLPGIQLLILISLLAAVLLLVNIRNRGWVLPAVAVGLWGIVAALVGEPRSVSGEREDAGVARHGVADERAERVHHRVARRRGVGEQYRSVAAIGEGRLPVGGVVDAPVEVEPSRVISAPVSLVAGTD